MSKVKAEVLDGVEGYTVDGYWLPANTLVDELCKEAMAVEGGQYLVKYQIHTPNGRTFETHQITGILTALLAAKNFAAALKETMAEVARHNTTEVKKTDKTKAKGSV